MIRRIVTGTAAASFAACADLLARAAAARPRGRRRDLVKAAAALVDALPGDPARTVAHDPWQRPVAVDAGFVADLFTALVSIDEALAERAAEHVLAWPRTYGLDAVLVPAACSLMGSAETRNSAAVQRLRTACLEHLRARIALPLEPPRDWTRASEVGCKCPRCSELSRFLADPERETWVFKAAEADRGHVESTIRTARCDVDVTTDRRGRPYSLVCTKNQASYERRVKQRKKDLADLARPEG